MTFIMETFNIHDLDMLHLYCMYAHKYMKYVLKICMWFTKYNQMNIQIYRCLPIYSENFKGLQ